MAHGDYFYERDYTYNVFHADEHLAVSLYREKAKGKLKWIDTWSWSTFFSERYANSRAESRIMKLRVVYDAKPLKD